MSHLSTYAEQLLTRWPLNPEEAVIDIYEHLSHDGCDNLGPKSELLDLYVITRQGHRPIYVYYKFHAENWFKGATVEYELDSSYGSLTLLSLTKDEWLYSDEASGYDDYDYEGLSSDHANRLIYLQKLEGLTESLKDLPAEEKDLKLKEELQTYLRPSVIEHITLVF